VKWLHRKINARRYRLRRQINPERLIDTRWLGEIGMAGSVLVWLCFVAGASAVMSVFVSNDRIEVQGSPQVLAIIGTVMLLSAVMALYIHKYQSRIIKNNLRGAAIAGLFAMLLVAMKLIMLLGDPAYAANLGAGVIVTCTIILTIAYDQRFAIEMSLLFSVLVWLAAGQFARVDILLTMAAGIFATGFALKDIRTRMKLVEVGVLAGVLVFITSGLLGIIRNAETYEVIKTATRAGLSVVVVGFAIQGILPLIEKTFRVATSMTLLDYSDASQPLLRRLAMEAPGTYSHSLLIGSISEAAADSIGADGLLCRVGAYYHDIGKMNKPGYFVENQMGAVSRHRELSPAMSQLVIIGHVKDGIEMAREYKLPSILRQFIEAHHGTTLIEYFYNEAKKRHQEENGARPAESDFRYPGPRPKTREAAIVMLADTVEGAVRSLAEVTPTRIEAVVHNMAMKRLQDGQFDQCDLTLRELSTIETSLAKSLTAHYHGRIAYPKAPDIPDNYQQIKIS
jgi:putative nucleotidyltransferase with HDIG domain